MDKLETAAFAAGCFWGVEDTLMNTPGVKETEVGYMGGHTENPTYEQVCTDTTGHAETVKLKFDPSEISYEKLLEVFWNLHDPTTVNRQGPDVGSQYRSVIFCYSLKQEFAAKNSKKALEDSKIYSRPIATEIVTAGDFYRAEEYHQKYVQKTGRKVC